MTSNDDQKEKWTRKCLKAGITPKDAETLWSVAFQIDDWNELINEFKNFEADQQPQHNYFQ